MAHESRAERFEYLLKVLGETTPLFIDRGSIGEPGNLGPWGNAKRAWAAYDPDCKFHMVVQDDVIFGKNFMYRAKRLVQKHGDNYAYLLFCRSSGNVTPEFSEKVIKARTKYKGVDEVVVEDDRLRWAQCVILPTRIIDEMIPFADSAEYTKNSFDDDGRIELYLQHIGMKVLYPIPSLVTQHHRYDSLVGYGHNSKRQAKWWI